MNSLDFDLAQEEAAKEEEAIRLAADEHFEQLYTDDEALNEAAKGPNIKQAELYSADPKSVRYSALNYAYLSGIAGRDLNPAEYELARDAYSEQTFGKKAATDQEFYAGVKTQYEGVQKQRVAASELYAGAVKQALDDELKGTSSGSVELFQKWREKNKEVVTADEELGFELNAFAVVRKAKEDIRAVAPQAARVWQSLTRYNEGEASEQDVRALGTELAAMPRDARQKVYRYAVIAAQANGGDTGPIQQAAKNLGQSIQRGFGWMESPLTLTNVGGALPMSIPTLSYRPLSDIEQEARTRIMQLERQPDSPAKTEEMARMRQTAEMTQVVRELKHVAEIGIDPVRPIFPEGKLAGTAERGIYGAAGSLGYMAATAVSPLLGLYAISGQEYDEMRRENPDMNPHAAGAASIVSGSIQTLLEMMQIRTYGGIGAALGGIKNGVAATAVKVGLGLAKENAQEAVQDAVSAGIPLVMSHLRSDMPDQDTYKLMKSYVGERGEVFFSTLALAPFGIVGSNYSPNDQTLSYLGFNSNQRKKILEASDQKAAFSEEIANRSQTSIEKGVKSLTADMAAAKAAQENADLPTLESAILPDGTREWRVIREAPPASTTPQYLTPAEMSGKNVTLSTVDPVTNNVVSLEMPAAQAQSLVKRNIDAYTQLIDCLIR